METTRQKKIGAVIQQDLTVILQQLLKETLSGSVIASVTKVRVSSDLSSAKTYISVFPVKNTEMIFDLFLKNSNYPEAYVIFQPLNHTSNSADEWVKKYAQKKTRDAYIEFISALKLKYYIVQTVDFSFIFNDIEEKFFNDTQHYNENGNTVLANNFFKFLYD